MRGVVACRVVERRRSVHGRIRTQLAWRFGGRALPLQLQRVLALSPTRVGRPPVLFSAQLAMQRLLLYTNELLLRTSPCVQQPVPLAW